MKPNGMNIQRTCLHWVSEWIQAGHKLLPTLNLMPLHPDIMRTFSHLLISRQNAIMEKRKALIIAF